MKIETDIKIIERISKDKEDENWIFRSYLKQLDIDEKELDSIVHKIYDEVVSQIDCTKCANCCRQISPILDKKDISKFAFGLKILFIKHTINFS